MANLFNNEKDENWKPWDNAKEGAEQPVSADHPEWVMLTWTKPVSLIGLDAVRAGDIPVRYPIVGGHEQRRCQPG